MFQQRARRSRAGGLTPYEVSSYAQPGRQSRHNRLYWSLSPYLGVGASAASFRPLDDGTAWRFSDPRATDVYLESSRAGQGSPAPRHVERRNAADLENEALWLGLRTADGVNRAAHRARHGVDPLAGRGAAADRAVADGWLAVDDQKIRLTEAGVLFADEIATVSGCDPGRGWCRLPRCSTSASIRNVAPSGVRSMALIAATGQSVMWR